MSVIEQRAATKYPDVRNYIGGQFVDRNGSQYLDITNPAFGSVISRVPLSGHTEVDRAVQAAKKAFPAWSATPIKERVQIFFRYKALLEKHIDALAALVSEENGKILSEGRAEVSKSAELTEFACSLPQLTSGEVLEVSRGVECRVERYPVGIVASIVPFNFPNMVPNWTLPNALALGNCMILKPSEMVPLSSMRLAELLREAGLPDGVFNVVHGDKESVDAILNSPDVAAVSFVGSTPIAKYIHERASATGKRVQALGGAKNHAIVLPDADIDFAADHLVAAAFGSAGERCMAISAAVAVGSAGDAIVSAVTAKANTVKVGSGRDAASEMGPVVSRAAKDRIVGLIGTGEAQGARLAVDGRQLVVDGLEDGFFVGPTVVDDVTTDMDVYREEIFGPVLSVLRVDTVEEAIALINANPYGNGTAIFTSSGSAARRFQRGVKVGMIGINVPVPVPMAYYSFGGWKDSLFGDKHVHGPEGVSFYTRAKVVTSRWPEQHHTADASYHFPTAT